MNSDKTNMYVNKKQSNKKKWLLLTGVVLLVVGGALLLYQRRSSNRVADNPTQLPVASNDEKLDLAPATDQDKKAAEDHKEDIVKQQEQSQNTTNKRSVTPVVTYAGKLSDNSSDYEITAFVPGIVESGTCTMNAVQGALKVSKTLPAEKDATTTRCQNFVVPRSDFPAAGQYNVTITYQSATAQGSSTVAKMEVQ
jgi:hypothetical protein